MRHFTFPGLGFTCKMKLFVYFLRVFEDGKMPVGPVGREKWQGTQIRQAWRLSLLGPISKQDWRRRSQIEISVWEGRGSGEQ